MRTIRSTAEIVALVLFLAFPCRVLAQGSRGGPGTELQVLSFNIRYGTAADGENRWELRKELVVSVLEEVEADIVGLQEALRFQIDEIRLAIPRLAETGVGRDDGQSAGEYSAILYNSERFDLEDEGTFWLSNTPEIPGSVSWGNTITRICSWGLFRDRKTDCRFYIFNTHFDHQSQGSRMRSSVLLKERIEGRPIPAPVIVTGDLNAGESNPAVQFLTGGQSSRQVMNATPSELFLRDSFRLAHPDGVQVGTFNNFSGQSDGPKIDYVLVGEGIEVVAAEINRREDEGRYPSDHFPVSAKLRLCYASDSN